jgi:3-isopropylmalate/(R)-2-methylmalate dehydratase small subunit
MEPLRIIRSRTVVLPASNVDTDQIIPARFLTTIARTGLAEHLFADWRYDAQGKPRGDFVLNRPEARGCGILVAGHNFGSGSSREHAPWALLDFGFRAVVSTAIADIFRHNALKNGLLPVVIDQASHAWLLAHPGVELEVDLERANVTLPDGSIVAFEIDAFARSCLLNGTDELGYLLSRLAAVEEFERRRARSRESTGP